MSYIVLSASDVAKLPASVQDAISQLLGLKAKASFEELPFLALPEATDHDDNWFALNVPLARKLVAQISDKTEKLLKLIVASNGNLLVSDALRQLGYEKWQDLRGIRAGLNRRIRSITGLKEIYILDWKEDEDSYDENGDYVDGVITMRPESIEALRKVWE